MPNQFGEITDRGLSASLQKRFGVDPNLSLSLMPELAATVVVDQMEELLFHMGWRRYMYGNTVAALAANAGRFRLRNPDASNILIKVEQILFGSSGAFCEATLNETIGAGIADLAGFVSGLNRDTRAGLGGGTLLGSAGRLSFLATAALAVAGVDVVTPVNQMQSIPGLPIFLVPGTAMDCGSFQVNQNFIFTVIWRERQINDPEIAP